MTTDQIEALYTALWGQPARIASYRTPGGTAYAIVADGRAEPLAASWPVGGGEIEFEPLPRCGDDLLECAGCDRCAAIRARD